MWKLKDKNSLVFFIAFQPSENRKLYFRLVRNCVMQRPGSSDFVTPKQEPKCLVFNNFSSKL